MKVQWNCQRCQKSVSVDVPEEGLGAWETGTLIQDALPDVHSDIREMLMMRWCLQCVEEVYEEMKETGGI